MIYSLWGINGKEVQTSCNEYTLEKGALWSWDHELRGSYRHPFVMALLGHSV